MQHAYKYLDETLGTTATSVPSERLLSSADDLISEKRSGLKPPKMSTCFCSCMKMCSVYSHSCCFHPTSIRQLATLDLLKWSGSPTRL